MLAVREAEINLKVYFSTLQRDTDLIPFLLCLQSILENRSLHWIFSSNGIPSVGKLG